MKFHPLVIGFLLALVASACAAAPMPEGGLAGSDPAGLATATAEISPSANPEQAQQPGLAITPPHVPTQKQAELMTGLFPQVSFDGIPPVYDPQFVAADQADMQPDELVIGIELHGESRAYPVSVLRFREMVNDEIRGTPILVSW